MPRVLLCDPVGLVDTATKRSTVINWFPDKRIATLFNNHVSSYRLWKQLEILIQERSGASAVRTFAKENTFAEAPRETIEGLVVDSDLAIVGVGA